jgi:Lipoate-protein ligase A
MQTWRLINDIPRSGSFNMAADQMLLERSREKTEPVFRLYDWECPTLSLGKNEKIDSLIDLRECQNLSIPLIRRMTGGKSVLHGFDLTYSLAARVMDSQFPGGILDNYNYLARGFKKFFQTLGLNPVVINKSLPPPKKKEPHICFSEVSSYEILIEGRKIIGSAQRVKINHGKNTLPKRFFLQHGSILLKDSIPIILRIFPYAHENTLRREIHSLQSVGIYPKYSKKKFNPYSY